MIDLGCGYNLRPITSRGDRLQTVCTLDTERQLPLVAICAVWRADQVLYDSCTLSIYNDAAVLSKIFAFGGEARSRRSSLYSGPIELCVLL